MRSILPFGVWGKSCVWVGLVLGLGCRVRVRVETLEGMLAVVSVRVDERVDPHRPLTADSASTTPTPYKHTWR